MTLLHLGAWQCGDVESFWLLHELGLLKNSKLSNLPKNKIPRKYTEKSYILYSLELVDKIISNEERNLPSLASDT